MGEQATRRRRHRRALADEELSRIALRRLQVSLGPPPEASLGPPPEASLGPPPQVASAVGDLRLDAVDPITPVADGWVPERPPPADPAEALGRRSLLPGGVVDRLPVGLRAAVVAPAGRAVVGLVVVVAVAVGATAAAAWLSRPQARPAPDRPHVEAKLAGSPMDGTPMPEGSAAPVAPSGGASPGTPVLVHVAGAVRRPGLVELAAGSRLADAIDAAGGLTRAGDPASVNLARAVVDGEQVLVARRGEVAAPQPPAVGGAVAASPAVGPVDLNTATLEQLDTLPGIGPVLAQRILDWRTSNGRFSTVDELGEVSGIGEATLSDLRPLVTV